MINEGVVSNMPRLYYDPIAIAVANGLGLISAFYLAVMFAAILFFTPVGLSNQYP